MEKRVQEPGYLKIEPDYSWSAALAGCRYWVQVMSTDGRFITGRFARTRRGVKRAARKALRLHAASEMAEALSWEEVLR